MAAINPLWEPVEGQEGLYVESYERVNSITGVVYTHRILHSADGYCFYDLVDTYYDDEGNQIPEEDVRPEMRVYYQYMSLTPFRNLSDFISVPVDPAYEIVNAPIGTETI